MLSLPSLTREPALPAGSQTSTLARPVALLVVAVGAVAALSGQSELGLVGIAGLAGLLLLIRNPPLFLGIAMGVYGSIQFILQESLRISIGQTSLNAAKLFVVATTLSLVGRLLLSLHQIGFGRGMPRSLVFAALVAIWSGLSMMRNFHGSEAFAVFARIVACTAAFWFAYTFVRTRRDFIWVWFGGSVTVIMSSGLAFLGFLAGDAMDTIRIGAFRASGGFGGAVVTGTVAFFGVALSIAMLTSGWLGVRQRLFAIATLGVGAFGILATFTRTAILGSIVFVSLYLLFSPASKVSGWNTGRRLFVVALLAVAFLGALSFVSEDAIEARVADLPGVGTTGDISAQAGSGRGLIWQTLLRHQVNATPGQWIFGHGLLSVSGYMRQSIGLALTAHNSYLESLFDSGIIGLLLYLGFVLAMLADLRRASEQSTGSTRLVLATWRHYYIAYFLSTVMFNGYLYMIGPRWYSMIVAGALLGYVRHAGSEEAEESAHQ